MSDARIRLYRFLVEMDRLAKEQFKEITGLEYDAAKQKQVSKCKGG